jgi:hypothetical protein
VTGLSRTWFLLVGKAAQIYDKINEILFPSSCPVSRE